MDSAQQVVLERMLCAHTDSARCQAVLQLLAGWELDEILDDV
jgi:hypothetical protein